MSRHSVAVCLGHTCCVEGMRIEKLRKSRSSIHVLITGILCMGSGQIQTRPKIPFQTSVILLDLLFMTLANTSLEEAGMEPKSWRSLPVRCDAGSDLP